MTTGPDADLDADLDAAKAVVDLAQQVVDRAAATLAAGSLDDQQVVAYDVAHAAAAVEGARVMLDYGSKGDAEARLACAFVADAVHDLMGKIAGREAAWGVERGALDGALDLVTS